MVGLQGSISFFRTQWLLQNQKHRYLRAYRLRQDHFLRKSALLRGQNWFNPRGERLRFSRGNNGFHGAVAREGNNNPVSRNLPQVEGPQYQPHWHARSRRLHYWGWEGIESAWRSYPHPLRCWRSTTSNTYCEQTNDSLQRTETYLCQQTRQNGC